MTTASPTTPVPTLSTTTQTQTTNQTITSKRTRCEIWTRVMGYHRSVSHFNIGKKAEHCSRQHYEETIVGNSAFCAKY